MARGTSTTPHDPQPGADDDGFGGDAPTPAEALPPGAEVIVSQPTETTPARPLPEAVGDVYAGGETVAITLRHHWTDAGGTSHAPGAQLDVDPFTADQLVASRFATKGHATSDGQPAPDAAAE